MNTMTITLQNKQTVALLKAIALYVRYSTTPLESRDAILEVCSMLTGIRPAACLESINRAEIKSGDVKSPA